MVCRSATVHLRPVKLPIHGAGFESLSHAATDVEIADPRPTLGLGRDQRSQDEPGPLGEGSCGASWSPVQVFVHERAKGFLDSPPQRSRLHLH